MGIYLIYFFDYFLHFIRFYKFNKHLYDLFITINTVRNIIMAHIQSFIENNQRMFKKTLSYYVMHITVAMMVGYIVTNNIWMALTLSFLEPTIQAFAYFFHERIWDKQLKNTKEELTI